MEEKNSKMRFKKCRTAFLAMFVLALAAQGCAGMGPAYNEVSTDSEEQNEENGAAKAVAEAQDEEKAADEEAEETGTDESQEAALGEAQVEEQVLLEQDGLKITLKSLEMEAFMGPELKLLIENGTDQDLTVQTRNSSVNGIMVETMFSCDVAAGKSANDGITFLSSELEDAQINVLQNFELSFHVFNADSWEDVFDSDTITISTNLDGSGEQAQDDSGVLLVDQDGVKITVKEADSEDSFWGADIYVYVENNSDKNITVQTGSVSLNGFMIEPLFSCEVASGKKAYDTITFMESELEENHIESIDSMEVSFRVLESESYDTIFETEPLGVEFESTN